MARPSLCLALLTACAVSAPASADTYVFVHDRGALNQVHAFSLAKNGDLTPVSGTPFLSNDPISNPDDLYHGLSQTMAGDKKSARLFTSGSTGVTVWNVGEDGSLSAVSGLTPSSCCAAER